MEKPAEKPAEKPLQKPWLKHYPAGVPAEISTTAWRSLTDVLEQSCARFATLPAYSNLGHTLSYADLDRLTQQFASFLQHTLGLQKGERVAVMMPNLLQYPVAIFGILRAGLVVVNVNPLYTPRELEHQLKDSGARAIVIIENFAETLEKVIARTPVQTVITTQVADLLPLTRRLPINFLLKHVKRAVPPWNLPAATPLRKALALGATRPPATVELTHADVAFLQYTGGTTGVSKGATLLHGNILANLQQASAWIGTVVEAGKETIVTALPLYHIFALTANCLVFMKFGAHNVLISNPRDLPGFVKTLSQHRFTAFTGVNTLFVGLLNTPEFHRLDFSALKLTLGGGAAVQKTVAQQWKQVTGKPLSEAYGLTETSPAASMNPLDLPEHNGSIGLPLPSTEFSIRDDDGRELPPGTPGELCIRGPQVMAGYWNRPEDTAATFTSDGFLKTGDVAQVDAHGFFTIVDRKKDMILVSGFNVYPNEIENVVASHPGVLEAACIGVPDAKSGEAVKLFVVRRDPALTVEDLRAYCQENLTGYKVPRHIEWRESLPKSPVGKILRRELR